MVKKYRKGYVAERELLHKLYEKGYAVIRAPKSGRLNLPCPDLIAIKNGKTLSIECKSRKNGFQISKDQLDELKEWERRSESKVLIGWKRSYNGWIFIPFDLVLKNKGNVGNKFADENGFKLDKL